MSPIDPISRRQFISSASLATASLAGLSHIAPGLFDADTKDGDTDALPKIWEDPAAFKERLTAFQTAAEDLDAVVKSGNAAKFGAALGALGKACKSCHDTFKEDD